MDKFYKTGEVAKLANLTIRTIRYYDQIDLLKPSKIDDNGYRLYTPSDLIKLQKITSLKQMGFSLENIKSMTISDSYLSLQKALRMQKDLVDKQIENLNVLSTMLDKLDFYLENNRDINWKILFMRFSLSIWNKIFWNNMKTRIILIFVFIFMKNIL